MISVVCVYNNKNILNDYLLKSLKNQTVNFQLIILDGTEERYHSAAQALNHGGKKAIGKYIMFVHQDVHLCSNIWLEEVEKMLDTISGLGIAGVAGMSANENSNGKRGKNIIKHGNPAKIWPLGTVIQKPELVQTLDECLVIIPKSVFDILQFDENVCDNWHLYAVDYCLAVEREGLGAYAIPIVIYHKSTGATIKNNLKVVLNMGWLPHEYYHTLDKLLKKHKPHIKRIYTTVDDWNTSYPLVMQIIQKLAKRGIGYLIRRLIKNNQK